MENIKQKVILLIGIWLKFIQVLLKEGKFKVFVDLFNKKIEIYL